MNRFIVASFLVACLASACLAGVPDCTSANVGATFASDTPLQYYTCNDAKTAEVVTCPTGSGYLSSQGACVSWSDWSCTSKAGAPACTSSEVSGVWPALYPYQWWMCSGVDEPMIMTCASGTAYIPVDSGEAATGCQPWATWSEWCPY